MSGPDAPVTLEESYRRCRALNRRHGTTYYASTFLLPAVKRPHVHALYGFCRYADEIVDDLGDTATEVREKALTDFGDRFLTDLAAGRSDEPVLKAVVHTARAFDLPPEAFERFLASMAMDLRVSTYETFDDLCGYMDGSAAVIGELMLPILEPRSADAVEPARALGIAFQLTNFLRDVAEDLDRGRVYLPLADLSRFGLTPADLRCASPRSTDLIAYEVSRARAHYARAAPGIPLLDPASQACMRTAYRLYGGILDEIEAAGYDVFARRATVPHRRRAAVAVRSLLTRPGTVVT
jgi:phytoene synthase